MEKTDVSVGFHILFFTWLSNDLSRSLDQLLVGLFFCVAQRLQYRWTEHLVDFVF